MATEGSALAAVAALLEGLDALRAVQRINGSVGGARARSRNLLPRYSAAVAEMTARLPTVVARTLPAAPSTTPRRTLGLSARGGAHNSLTTRSRLGATCARAAGCARGTGLWCAQLASDRGGAFCWAVLAQ